MAEGGRETERIKREELETVYITDCDINQKLDNWSEWYTVMSPKRDEEMTEERDDFGFYSGDLGMIPNECGIYEIAVERASGDFSFCYAAYVGYSCKCLPNAPSSMCQLSDHSGLRNRITAYCQSGSHKAGCISEALRSGDEIAVRYRKVRNGNEEEVARMAEQHLLRRADYAWNLKDNDKWSPRSINFEN